MARVDCGRESWLWVTSAVSEWVASPACGALRRAVGVVSRARSGAWLATTRASSTETCATTGGTTESHTYDEADRLIDTGVEYETFGNQTKIPAADAGEHEIAASFYLDNQVATQKQNGETTNYSYDPPLAAPKRPSPKERPKRRSSTTTPAPAKRSRGPAKKPPKNAKKAKARNGHATSPESTAPWAVAGALLRRRGLA